MGHCPQAPESNAIIESLIRGADPPKKILKKAGKMLDTGNAGVILYFARPENRWRPKRGKRGVL